MRADQSEASRNEKKFNKKAAQNETSSIKFTKQTLFFPMARQPYMGLGLLVSSRFHDHTF
jgi:hypothetical protein